MAYLRTGIQNIDASINKNCGVFTKPIVIICKISDGVSFPKPCVSLALFVRMIGRMA